MIRLPDDTEHDDKAEGSRQPLFEYSWLPVEVPSLAGRLFYPEEPLYTSGATMPRQWLVASAELEGG